MFFSSLVLFSIILSLQNYTILLFSVLDSIVFFIIGVNGFSGLIV